MCLVSVCVFGRLYLCLVVSCVDSLCVCVPCLRVEDHFLAESTTIIENIVYL